MLRAVLAPNRSLHEDPVHQDRVLSQHLSIKRVLRLMDGYTAALSAARADEAAFDLVLVARIDLIFYSDLVVTQLQRPATHQPSIEVPPPASRPPDLQPPGTTAPPATSLWLPEYCHPRLQGLGVRTRLVREAARRGCGTCPRGVAHACSSSGAPAAAAHGPQQQVTSPSWEGSFWQRPTAQRIAGRIYGSLNAQTSYTSIVNDVWFISTPAVARSFVWIYDAHQGYIRALKRALLPSSSSSPPFVSMAGGDQRTGSMKQRGRGGAGGGGPDLVRFAHFFWAYHIGGVLAPAGVGVGFTPADFTLVRTCSNPTPIHCRVPFINDPSRRGSAGYVGAAAAEGARAHASRELERRLWTNASRQHGVGWLVARQCPLRLHLGEDVRCAWDAPACAAARRAAPKWQERVRRSVAMCVWARRKAEDP